VPLVVYRLTQIAVWPVVRIAFLVNAVIGLIFGSLSGILLFAAGLAMDTVVGRQLPFDLDVMSGVFGFLLAILSGVMYGFFGAMFAVVAVWLYNVMAEWGGPVELTLEPEESAPKLSDLSGPEVGHDVPTHEEPLAISDEGIETPDGPTAQQLKQ
ncbi:uncharacterized protein METZ01_LOCUS271248, partial [marine metagenome]